MRKLLIAVTVIASIFIIYLVQKSGPKPLNLNIRDTATRIDLPWYTSADSKDTIWLANNRGLVSYNTTSGESKFLTEPTTSLPTPTYVHLSPRGDKALVYLPEAGNDTLFSYLLESTEEETITPGTWWLADLNTTKYTYIGGDYIGSIGWKDADTFFFTISNPDEPSLIVERNLATNKSVQLTIGVPATRAVKTKSGYLIVGKDNETFSLYELKNGQTTKIIEDVNSDLFISPDKTVALFTQGPTTDDADVPEGELTQFNVIDGSTKKRRAETILTEVAWGDSNEAYFASVGNIVKLTATETFEMPLPEGGSPIRYIRRLSNSLIFQDGSNNILVADLGEGDAINLAPFKTINQATNVTSGLISSSETPGSFLVSDVSSDPADDSRIANEFKTIGIDSNLVNYTLGSSFTNSLDDL